MHSFGTEIDSQACNVSLHETQRHMGPYHFWPEYIPRIFTKPLQCLSLSCPTFVRGDITFGTLQYTDEFVYAMVFGLRGLIFIQHISIIYSGCYGYSKSYILDLELHTKCASKCNLNTIPPN